MKYRFAPAFFLVLVLFGCSEQSATRQYNIASRGIYDAYYHADSEQLLTSTFYDYANMWALSPLERKFKWSLDEETTFSQVHISDDGRWSLTADLQKLALWDNATGENKRYWITPSEILDAQLSRQGQYAILGLRDNQAVIFDVQNGGIKKALPHADKVNSVAWHNTTIATGSEDNHASIWSTSGKKSHQLAHNRPVHLVKLTKNGKHLLTASQYDGVYYWDTNTGEQLFRVDLNRSHLARGLTVFSADHLANTPYWLFGRSDGLISLWDSSQNKHIGRWRFEKRHAWKPNRAKVTHVAFISIAKAIVITSDGQLHHLSLTDATGG